MRLLTKEDVKKLLQKRFSSGFKRLREIPSPNLLHDAKRAAKRIAQAIKNQERIAVVGDYDVDGVVATAIVVEFFRFINYPLFATIPNRFHDGYGVSATILERIDADVLITVDNGITAVEAANICKERGIDLIITDHHTPPATLPEAFAIVNPKLESCSYPFKDICGAEVAWLLLGLVKQELGANINMRSFVDLLAIAIIADIMPLVDINRALVQDGLQAIMCSSRPASIIIRDFLGKNRLTSEDIAFMIAPRINSAGRLEDASLALEFLTAKTTYKGYEAFERLSELNELRKELEAEATKEAIGLVNEHDSVIVVAKEGWHEGVVGIVASRLVDRFQKPAIVLSIEDGVAKGSARSLGEVDIFDLMNQNRAFLEKFGGHKMAAGLSLETKNLQAFKEAINTSAKALPKEAFIPKDNLFGMLHSDAIDFELLEILESFEPYGEANERPKFLAKDAKVIKVESFGMDASHSKLFLQLHPNDRKIFEFICFRKSFPKNLEQISCSYTINRNEFRGEVNLQLIISQVYES